MSEFSCRTAVPNLTHPFPESSRGTWDSSLMQKWTIFTFKKLYGVPTLKFLYLWVREHKKDGKRCCKRRNLLWMAFLVIFFRVNRPNLLLFHVVKVKGKKKTFPLTQTCFWSLKTKSEYLRRSNNSYFGNNDLKTDRNCCKVGALARLSHRKSEL